jgi:Uma2 family endonuclease
MITRNCRPNASPLPVTLPTHDRSKIMLFNRKPVITEKRITLPDVTWEKLEMLLADLGNTRSTRITYYQGKLEMLEPPPQHDRVTRLIDSLLQVIADEAGDDLLGLGSQLLKQAEMGIAIQPDACYYLAQRVQPEARAELDLSQVAPPNLAIDVQFGEASSRRLGLMAGLGIPEVWQYVTSLNEAEVLQGELTLLALVENDYEAIPHSRLYDYLDRHRIAEFIAQSDTIGLTQSLTVLRSWARSV